MVIKFGDGDFESDVAAIVSRPLLDKKQVVEQAVMFQV
jgi:hypothetical protein